MEGRLQSGVMQEHHPQPSGPTIKQEVSKYSQYQARFEGIT